MKIYFKSNPAAIVEKLKAIIPKARMKTEKNFISFSWFRKGFIYDKIPQIENIYGVIKVSYELPEIMPQIFSKNFHFKKPFNSQKKFVIAGPCVIHDFDIFEETAKELEELGIEAIRSPLFKPRTSPYSWEGFGVKGLNNLRNIKRKIHTPFVMEILDVRLLDKIDDVCDIIQIGARNMKNYVLLKECAKTSKPIILKRQPKSTLKEFLFSAEYLARYGAKKIILCERGDNISDGIPSINIKMIKDIKKLLKIPVIADVSHSAKKRSLVERFTLSSIKYADGIMIEVSTKPELSPIDTKQIIDIETFKSLLKKIR